MKKRLVKILSIFFLTLTLSTTSVELPAQCSMCRMATEKGGEETKGINNGILYMLATPYLIIGVIGFVWWRNRRKEEEIA